MRQRLSAIVARTVVLCAAAGVGLCAAAQEVPLVSGNLSIAQKFLHGNAHVLVLGDSIQNDVMGAYPKQWKPDRWTGQVVGPNLNTTPSGNSGAYGVSFNSPAPPFVGSSFTYLPDSPPPGLAGFAPGAVQHVTFNGTAAPAESSLLQNRIVEYGLNPGQEQIYASGKWADRPSGTIHVDVLLYANPQGLASGARFDVRTLSDATAALSLPLDASAGQGRIVTVSGTFPAHTWSPTTGLAGQFRLLGGTTPPQGSNLPILGVRVHTGEPGFQLASIAWGGKGIDYYLDPANTTQQNLADYIDATDSNIAFVWLGQNDTGKYTATQWKQKVLDLIARYKGARADMDFVLVSSYDTDQNAADGNQLGEYARVLHEIAQSDPDVLFLNLFKAAGPYSSIQPSYLSDTVHPNAAGANYFAGKTQELLELADGQVPEPGAAVGVVGLVLALWGRRRV